MLNIDQVMNVPLQIGDHAKPIETFGCFYATPPLSKTDPADGEVEMPCSAATAFAAESTPPAGRRPLFRSR
jgi:hypothetical protein